MRKNNDGYVIIYVIFVILFLCIVAIGTCSSALSNLKSQNEAVVQMQEKYAAEGEIERLAAEMCAGINRISGINVKNPKDDAYSQIQNLNNPAVAEIVIDKDNNNVTCKFVAGTNSAISAKIIFTVVVTYNETGKYFEDAAGNPVKEEDYDESQHKTGPLYKYTATAVSQYLSYAIESTGGDAV